MGHMQALEDRVDVSGTALEESAGISAPLYDVVDVLFQLQSRGFFRRQVCHPTKDTSLSVLAYSELAYFVSLWEYTLLKP